MDIDNLYISNIHRAAGKLIRCRLQNLTDENHNILNTLERTKVYIIIITIQYIHKQSIRAIYTLLACLLVIGNVT